MILGRRYGLATGLVILAGGIPLAGLISLGYAGMILALILTAEALAEEYMFRTVARSVFSGVSLGLAGVCGLAPFAVVHNHGWGAFKDIGTFISLIINEVAESTVHVGPESPAVGICLCSMITAAGARLLSRTFCSKYRLRSTRPPWA